MATSRREFAKSSLALAGGFGLQGLLTTSDPANIVCIGGHPDDPESGCGGTLARLSAAGHTISILYLTRGEAGIAGTPPSTAAEIRTREAVTACSILRANPYFLGQIDGETILNNEWVARLLEQLDRLKPNLIFTHWPFDSHKDHQVASLLAMQAWTRMGRKIPLYFFEVCAGSQTMGFHPTDYVDITSTREQKRKAVYCHASQKPDEIYEAPDCNHALMEKFRGAEMNVEAAEAFVRLGKTGLPLG